jgi:hypothetical protein
MKQLRSLHLYLGCFFSPMLLFFAMSGFWQTYDRGYAYHSRILWILSTIHTEAFLKSNDSLANPILRDFVLVMTLAFIVTTILGIIMAVKHSSRKAAYCCLAFGVLFPLAVILIPFLLREHARTPTVSQGLSAASGIAVAEVTCRSVSCRRWILGGFSIKTSTSGAFSLSCFIVAPQPVSMMMGVLDDSALMALAT